MPTSLNKETPQQAIERIVGTVAEEIFRNQAIPPEVRRRAKEFASQFDYADATYLGPEARRAAGSEYDTWIDEIFRSILSGDWREDLLRQFIDKLSLFMVSNKSDAMFALVVEEITDGRQFVRYQLGEHYGPSIHEKHWRSYGRLIGNGKDRRFFRAMLEAGPEQADIGVWHGRSMMGVFPYQGELDTLLNRSLPSPPEFADKADAFWLSALALKSEEADQPHRLLLVAYPNRGSAASPKIGRGASHEWRIMQLLRIAYRQLDHEIRHLDRRIAAQREYLIRDLGPGFLAHELHTHLANLHDLHALMADDAKALLRNHPGDPKIQVTAERLLLAIQETTRLFHVVHGYNNMMRARQVEVFSLDEVVEEALALTRIRIREYAKAKSQVERKRAQAIRVESDHSLLLVVLVNVLVNASQAIYGARPPRGQSEPPPGGDRITILVESAPDDEQVVLLIANTGPAVSPELRERIFKRGYTTRPQGHGQGLFLCKQILENLGGDIAYVDPASHGLSPGAAFRIAFAQHCNKASNEGDRK